MSKVSRSQILRNMKKFIGKDVIIQSPNSHVDSRGKMTGVTLKNKKPASIIMLDSGEEIIVQSNKEILFLIPKTGELNEIEKSVMAHVNNYAVKN